MGHLDKECAICGLILFMRFFLASGHDSATIKCGFLFAIGLAQKDIHDVCFAHVYEFGGLPRSWILDREKVFLKRIGYRATYEMFKQLFLFVAANCVVSNAKLWILRRKMRDRQIADIRF
jgi:hypothetical protein